MDVVLTPDQDDAAERLVAAGIFASKEDAISHSHEWLCEEAVKLEEFRGEIQKGIDQADRGDLVDARDVLARLKKDHEKDFGPQNWRA